MLRRASFKRKSGKPHILLDSNGYGMRVTTETIGRRLTNDEKLAHHKIFEFYARRVTPKSHYDSIAEALADLYASSPPVVMGGEQ